MSSTKRKPAMTPGLKDARAKAAAVDLLSDPNPSSLPQLKDKRRPTPPPGYTSSETKAYKKMNESTGSLKSGKEYDATLNLLMADTSATKAYFLTSKMGLGSNVVESFRQKFSYSQFVDVVTEGSKKGGNLEFASNAVEELGKSTPLQRFARAVSLIAGEQFGKNETLDKIGGSEANYLLTGSISKGPQRAPLLRHMISLANQQELKDIKSSIIGDIYLEGHPDIKQLITERTI